MLQDSNGKFRVWGPLHFTSWKLTFQFLASFVLLRDTSRSKILSTPGWLYRYIWINPPTHSALVKIPRGVLLLQNQWQIKSYAIPQGGLRADRYKWSDKGPPTNGLVNRVTGVITLLIGVISSRGPHLAWDFRKKDQWFGFLQLVSVTFYRFNYGEHIVLVFDQEIK